MTSGSRWPCCWWHPAFHRRGREPGWSCRRSAGCAPGRQLPRAVARDQRFPHRDGRGGGRRVQQGHISGHVAQPPPDRRVLRRLGRRRSGVWCRSRCGAPTGRCPGPGSCGGCGSTVASPVTRGSPAGQVRASAARSIGVPPFRPLFITAQRSMVRAPACGDDPETGSRQPGPPGRLCSPADMVSRPNSSIRSSSSCAGADRP